MQQTQFYLLSHVCKLEKNFPPQVWKLMMQENCLLQFLLVSRDLVHASWTEVYKLVSAKRFFKLFMRQNKSDFNNSQQNRLNNSRFFPYFLCHFQMKPTKVYLEINFQIKRREIKSLKTSVQGKREAKEEHFIWVKQQNVRTSRENCDWHKSWLNVNVNTNAGIYLSLSYELPSIILWLEMFIIPTSTFILVIDEAYPIPAALQTPDTLNLNQLSLLSSITFVSLIMQIFIFSYALFITELSIKYWLISRVRRFYLPT